MPGKEEIDTASEVRKGGLEWTVELVHHSLRTDQFAEGMEDMPRRTNTHLLAQRGGHVGARQALQQAPDFGLARRQMLCVRHAAGSDAVVGMLFSS